MPWGWMKEMGDKIILFSISSPQGSIVIKIGTMNLRDYLAFNARALTTMKPKDRSRPYRGSCEQEFSAKSDNVLCRHIIVAVAMESPCAELGGRD